MKKSKYIHHLKVHHRILVSYPLTGLGTTEIVGIAVGLSLFVVLTAIIGMAVFYFLNSRRAIKYG